jgi:hypothetical protein
MNEYQLHKNSFSESRADTFRQGQMVTDMTMLIGAFHKHANVPNKNYDHR